MLSLYVNFSFLYNFRIYKGNIFVYFSNILIKINGILINYQNIGMTILLLRFRILDVLGLIIIKSIMVPIFRQIYIVLSKMSCQIK